MNLGERQTSIFFQPQTLLLFIIFFTLRGVSYLLDTHLVFQGITVFAIILLFGALYFKNPVLAWCVVLGEIFLGGSGHFLELGQFSLRTMLMGMFLLFWIMHSVGTHMFLRRIQLDLHITIPLLLFGMYLFFSIANAASHNHPFIHVYQDLIPYVFFFILFPLHHLFSEEKFRNYFTRLLLVYIFGTAAWSSFIFFMYSRGVLQLQDTFYHWFRNESAGKITDIGQGFFRVVEPSHLLIVPATLFLASLLMRKERHHVMWRLALVACILILVLNFSRMYILALLLSFPVLLIRHSFISWLRVAGGTIATFFILFISVSFIASNGTTFGFDMLGLRAASIARPQIEYSSASRMALLPEIVPMIEEHPLFGEGIGAEISYFTPDYQRVTTRQFDWGYLEMLAELGIVGTLLFMSIVIYSGYRLFEKILLLPTHHDFYVGLLAGLVSLLIMNITIPALFHVFGILFLVFVISASIAPHTLFHKILEVLYRVFRTISQYKSPEHIHLLDKNGF